MRAHILLFASVLAGAACSSSDPDPDATEDAGPPGPDVGPPVARCDAPPLADVSTPTATVGDGTAASCTAAELQNAAPAGGVIVFDCGPDPITITVTSQITFTEETILDGGGLVTLSGGGSSRI